MKTAIDLATVRQYANLELLARQMVEGFITGLHKSPYHGFSVEFAEHKIYNPGESTRYIDWKVFARTDRLYTKRFEEETNLKCHILLDASSSMYYPSPNYDKLTFSTLCAACLSYLLQRQRDAVGLIQFSDEIELQTPVKSTPGHMHQLLLHMNRLLQTAPPEPTQTKASKVIHQLADKLGKRSLIVIFSDMFEHDDTDELFGALQHLKHNLHEVLLFHVADKKTELNFEFEDRPYEFIDLETSQKVKVQPHQVRDTYREHLKTFFDDLKNRCGQYKIDMIEADTSQSIDQILLPYLIKRKKMR